MRILETNKPTKKIDEQAQKSDSTYARLSRKGEYLLTRICKNTRSTPARFVLVETLSAWTLNEKEKVSLCLHGRQCSTEYVRRKPANASKRQLSFRFLSTRVALLSRHPIALSLWNSIEMPGGFICFGRIQKSFCDLVDIVIVLSRGMWARLLFLFSVLSFVLGFEVSWKDE